MNVEKKLFIIPRAGLCNRLRAMASAIRISHLMNFSCVIIWWDWGRFEDLLQVAGFSVLHTFPEELKDKNVEQTKLLKDGGGMFNQNFNFLLRDLNIVYSGHMFNDRSLPAISLADLKLFLPKPSAEIRLQVDLLKKQLFKEKKIVGIHIRRTDHQLSIEFAPDKLFESEIANAVRDGYEVFLSSDNEYTLTRFRKIFGEKIITNTKKDKNKIRWPKAAFDYVETKEDFIDLLLLASSEYVLGSYFSSFSEMAILLNGNVKSRILKK